MKFGWILDELLEIVEVHKAKESYFLEKKCTDNATNIISRQQDCEKTIFVGSVCNYVFKTM